jgi:hypothetical protein
MMKKVFLFLTIIYTTRGCINRNKIHDGLILYPICECLNFLPNISFSTKIETDRDQ